jgi:outer membrane protein TolC
MKKYIRIFGLFLLATVAPARTQPPATGSVQPLTLREAVGIPLEKNPGIQAADAYAQAVQEGVTAAKSFRYPRMDFSEGFTRGPAARGLRVSGVSPRAERRSPLQSNC